MNILQHHTIIIIYSKGNVLGCIIEAHPVRKKERGYGGTGKTGVSVLHRQGERESLPLKEGLKFWANFGSHPLKYPTMTRYGKLRILTHYVVKLYIYK